MQTTTITDSPLFDKTRDALETGLLVAFDGCHKMYVAMDKIEADWFRAEYPHVVEGTPERMLAALGEWWEQSCPLRFINAVSHNAIDPNAGFVDLIAQGEGEDDEDDWDDWDDEDDEDDED